jgi:peptide/nickel transport system ATP-binding protein
MKTDDILTVDCLKKYFIIPQGTVKAVNGISFSVKSGETLGIVGESGSGKSTVAYVLSGIYSVTEGNIIYKGKYDINQSFKKRSRELKRDIQIVFQNPGSSLNPAKRIKEILDDPLKFHNIGKNKNDREEKIVELLETVGLSTDYMYKYPWTIGGGEKQMVAIARALLVDPSLILLDEPTSSLDVSVQAKVINSLIQLQKKLNLTYIFITHDLSLMRNVASRIAIMYLGKICEVAQSSEFFDNPLHPYTRMLISSVMVISEEEEKLKPKDITSIGEIPSPINIPPGCGFYSRCPKKMEICKREDPFFVEITKGHTVRCHLFKK